jgi:hypothetical protein
MLTRHAPLHALGNAEVGWLVGESDGQSHLAGYWMTAQAVCSNYFSSSQVKSGRSGQLRSAEPIETNFPIASVIPIDKKPRVDPLSRLKDRRGKNGHPRPKTPNRCSP